MANLTNRQKSALYPELLTLDTAAGSTMAATARPICDGMGNASLAYLATLHTGFGGVTTARQENDQVIYGGLAHAAVPVQNHRMMVCGEIANGATGKLYRNGDSAKYILLKNGKSYGGKITGVIRDTSNGFTRAFECMVVCTVSGATSTLTLGTVTYLDEPAEVVATISLTFALTYTPDVTFELQVVNACGSTVYAAATIELNEV